MIKQTHCIEIKGVQIFVYESTGNILIEVGITDELKFAPIGTKSENIRHILIGGKPENENTK